MIRKYIYLLFGLLSCACNKELTMLHDTENAQPVSVEMRFSAEDMPEITRVADESAIRDLNLYLFNATTGAAVHVYKSSATCSFECLPGRYTLYAVANMHRDLGKQTTAQINALNAAYSDNYTDLPMTGTAQIEVPAPRNGETVKLPAVVLRRNVAKIAYNVLVDPAMSDIQLRSVQLFSLASPYPLFEGSASTFRDAEFIPIPAASASRFSGIAYVPENMQGEVPAITNERDKNMLHAPKNATYLLIRGTRGDSVLDYRVYLGENNTSDFNVRRNTRQTLDIVIKGVKQTDVRYNSYIASVSDNFDNLGFNNYCIPRPTVPWKITLNIERMRDDGMRFFGIIKTLSGDFTINDAQGGYCEYLAGVGRTQFEASYTPTVVTKDNSRFNYRVTLADEYGYSQDFDIDHLCANNISVHRQNGTITATGALCTTDSGPLFRALCYQNGCTFTAKPDADYTFGGWYADEACTQRLSAELQYKHMPQTTYDQLYTRFDRIQGNVTIYTDPQVVKFTSDKGASFDADLEAFIVPYGSACTLTVNYRTPLFKGWYDKISGLGNQLSTAKTYTFNATENRTIAPAFLPAKDLSAAGTANCYIAPIRNAGYTFNARTQGNGKATTAITPKTLSGTTARVLWETGGTRGNVITGAEYNGGVICFRTGTNYGNALIGLFDAANKCVWAWHIWVTNYDPEATAQTYAAGRIFMDRNIGALSATVTDPSFRGLYYQWGRPAPFVYPATTNGTTRATVVHAPGYPFSHFDPMNGSTMTLENSLAHPWVYMLGYYPANDRDEAYNDWLKPQNPNLWGNASSGNRYSAASAKSIYDPCPPGWKVPDPAAFTNAALTRSSTSAMNGYYLKSSNGTTAIYPMSGYFTGSTFLYNGSEASVWSNAPAQANNIILSTSTVLWITPSILTPSATAQRDYARPVRCVRE